MWGVPGPQHLSFDIIIKRVVTSEVIIPGPLTVACCVTWSLRSRQRPVRKSAIADSGPSRGLIRPTELGSPLATDGSEGPCKFVQLTAPIFRFRTCGCMWHPGTFSTCMKINQGHDGLHVLRHLSRPPPHSLAERLGFSSCIRKSAHSDSCGSRSDIRLNFRTSRS
jgi:hypothetical protein